MLRRLLILSALLLALPGAISVAQERFELAVPLSSTKSIADLTDAKLTITNEGQASVYSRDAKYDAPGYVAYSSATLRQVIRWPTKGAGAMQIGTLTGFGAPLFRPSQMQITRIGGTPPVGLPAAGSSGPVDASKYYRLTNEFLKADRSLGAQASGATEMVATGQLDSQLWRFVVAGPKTYRMANVALGEKFSLAATTTDPRPTMQPTDLTSKSQLWGIVADGTAFRLINESLGPGFSLDNNGAPPNEPVMSPTGNVSGQFWTLTELPGTPSGGIVGSWESLQVGTNVAQGFRIEIRSDHSFLGTEPGKPDRLGTMQLVGDQLTVSSSGAPVDQFLVTLTPNRIDFRTMSGVPTGYYWRRVGAGLGINLASPAFGNGAEIPLKYTGAGDDISPPLIWSDAPVGTKSFALICDDPDAPSRAAPRPEGPWVHWVIYNIPANVRELPAGVFPQPGLHLPSGARQGANDFTDFNIGYRGPMPPKGSGPHRYFFRIYALDQELNLAANGATKQSVLAAMTGHVLAEGELMGTFEWHAAGPGPRNLVSRKVIPNPPLEPATVTLQNSHSNELWVLVTDLRDPKQSSRVKIPAKMSMNMTLERDAGARVIEVWRIPLTGIEQERVVEIPPQQLYDMSVYEIAVLSVVRDRTNKGSGQINNVIGAPKSVGFYLLPPGDLLKDGPLDIYDQAKRQNNTGAVRRINPQEWETSEPKGDALPPVR